ncbi:hypothetical protein FB451DRAFT_1185148 [Mycena latifolia]|nr:hypothetical protein FB451DRAFT_1185148 [Mycena latifolia]
MAFHVAAAPLALLPRKSETVQRSCKVQFSLGPAPSARSLAHLPPRYGSIYGGELDGLTEGCDCELVYWSRRAQGRWLPYVFAGLARRGGAAVASAGSKLCDECVGKRPPVNGKFRDAIDDPTPPLLGSELDALNGARIGTSAVLRVTELKHHCCEAICSRELHIAHDRHHTSRTARRTGGFLCLELTPPLEDEEEGWATRRIFWSSNVGGDMRSIHVRFPSVAPKDLSPSSGPPVPSTRSTSPAAAVPLLTPPPLRGSTVLAPAPTTLLVDSFTSLDAFAPPNSGARALRAQRAQTQRTRRCCILDGAPVAARTTASTRSRSSQAFCVLVVARRPGEPRYFSDPCFGLGALLTIVKNGMPDELARPKELLEIRVTAMKIEVRK